MKTLRLTWQFIMAGSPRWFAVGVPAGILAAFIAWFLAVPLPRSTADLKVRVDQRLLRYSPSGRYLCTHGYHNPDGRHPAAALKVWDASVRGSLPCVFTLQTAERRDGISPAFKAVISPDDKRIVSEWRWEDHNHWRLTIASLPEGKPVVSRAVEFSSNSGGWQSLIWSPDGRWLAATKEMDWGGDCHVWDSQTLGSACVIPHVRQAAFSSDGNQLFAREAPPEDETDAERGVIVGWSIRALPSGRRLAFHSQSGIKVDVPMTAQMAWNGQLVVMGTVMDEQATVQLRDAVLGQEIAAFAGEDQPLVSRDGQLLLTRKHRPMYTRSNEPATFQLRDALTGTRRSTATIPGEWPNVSATDHPSHPFQVTSYQRIYSRDGHGWSSPSWRGRYWGYHQQIAVLDAATSESLGRFDSREAQDWPIVSPVGDNVAWVDKRKDGVLELQIYDLPQRMPWGWIVTVGLLAAAAAVIGYELLLYWRYET